MIDASTLFAGPMAAMHLGDLGAEVIKVEHPRRPDPSRGHGPEKDGHNLWWKTLGRNKQTVAIDLSAPDGQSVFRRLAATADVVIENFRPGHPGALGPRVRRAQRRQRPDWCWPGSPGSGRSDRTGAGPASAPWPRR